MDPKPSRRCHLMIIEDHPAVREGVRLVLEHRGVTVCHQAADEVEANEYLARARPDLILVDLTLKQQSALPLIERLHARGVPVVVYSMHEDSVHVRQAFAAGAMAYVTKSDSVEALVHAIDEAQARRRYLSERASSALLAGTPAAGNGAELDQLSAREVQVLNSLGQGDGSDEIAHQLHISPRTVESYYARIIQKLGLSSMKRLRRYAICKFRGDNGGEADNANGAGPA